MLLLSQPLFLLQADSETTVLLCLMSVILLTAFILFLAANRIGNLEKQREAEKRCPYCAELIKKDATICRFCGRDLPVPGLPQQPAVMGTVDARPPLEQSTKVAEPIIEPPTVSKPVIQQPDIQESITQPPPKPQSPKQTKTMNRSLLGLGAIAVILILCIGFAVVLGVSKLLNTSDSSSDSSSYSASSPTSSPSPSFVMPSDDFEMRWDIYNHEYNTLGGTVTIRKQGSKYTEQIVMSDGSSGIYDLTVISEGSEIKLSGHLGDPYSLYPHDYIQIESNGWLGFYDDQGYIYSAPPLK